MHVNNLIRVCQVIWFKNRVALAALSFNTNLFILFLNSPSAITLKRHRSARHFLNSWSPSLTRKIKPYTLFHFHFTAGHYRVLGRPTNTYSSTYSLGRWLIKIFGMLVCFNRSMCSFQLRLHSCLSSLQYTIPNALRTSLRHFLLPLYPATDLKIFISALYKVLILFSNFRSNKEVSVQLLPYKI